MGQLRKEVAELLRADRAEYAWIRVEAIIRENNLSTAYEILELYLELLAVRCALLEKAKEVPGDMVEAITSLMYAAPRVSDLPELLQVRSLLVHRFGKELGTEDSRMNEEPSKWQVNVNLRRCLAVSAPEPEDKLAMLSHIAQEYNVDFNMDEFSQTVMIQTETKLANAGSEYAGNFNAITGAAGATSAAMPGVLPAPTQHGNPHLAPGVAVSAGVPVDSIPPQGGAIPAPLPAVPKTKLPATSPPVEKPTVPPKYPPKDTPSQQHSLPPENPDFSVPHWGPSVGQYTDAQSAATAAFKAAEAAQLAAEAAARYAGKVPPKATPPVTTSSSAPTASTEPAVPNKEIAHPAPAPEVSPTGPDMVPCQYKVKSKEELQRQYEAALGAPEKKDVSEPVPSAPPAPELSETQLEVDDVVMDGAKVPRSVDGLSGLPVDGLTQPPQIPVNPPNGDLDLPNAPQYPPPDEKGLPEAPQAPPSDGSELPHVPQYPPPGMLSHIQQAGPVDGNELPQVPLGLALIGGVEDLPSVPVVPGGISDKPEGGMDALDKRFENLKKRD